MAAQVLPALLPRVRPPGKIRPGPFMAIVVLLAGTFVAAIILMCSSGCTSGDSANVVVGMHDVQLDRPSQVANAPPGQPPADAEPLP